jgi:hypothetical protein
MARATDRGHVAGRFPARIPPPPAPPHPNPAHTHAIHLKREPLLQDALLAQHGPQRVAQARHRLAAGVLHLLHVAQQVRMPLLQRAQGGAQRGCHLHVLQAHARQRARGGWHGHFLTFLLQRAHLRAQAEQASHDLQGGEAVGGRLCYRCRAQWLDAGEQSTRVQQLGEV